MEKGKPNPYSKRKIKQIDNYAICINSPLDEKLFEKNQSGPARYINNWNALAIGKIHSLWCKRRKD
jgi:hypothetical protein